MGLQGVKKRVKGLQGITTGYIGFQGVTKGLQIVIKGYTR